MEINLQFFGGRGSDGGGGGESLSEGSGKKVNVIDTLDVWSYRHNPKNQPYVDSINQSVKDMNEDFPGLMDFVSEVDTATLGGRDKTETLGFYGNGRVALNSNYTNVDKMNTVYDKAVESGFHPSRGDKNGTQAVAYHEMGHALSDYIGSKNGMDIDQASKTIVERAYKATKGKGGTKAWAGKISGYAQQNYAECVAEAVCDYYCNGNKASSASKAIIKEMKNF